MNNRTEAQRAKRNLNPHAEARVAMLVWGERYSKQSGGSMDFYDSLTDSERNLCREWAREIHTSHREIR